MKRMLIVGMLLIGGCTFAAVETHQTFTENATVTAGSPIGSVFTETFNQAGAGNLVLGISVDLNVTGGYSGSFYLYLVGPDGSTTVTLLNQPGTSTSGLNIRFQDGGTAINSSSDLSVGTSSPYAPYEALSGLNGQSANGNWTLYFADLASGGGNPTLNSWTLNIDVVPEPVNMALGVFGVMFVVIMAAKRRKRHEPGIEEA